MTVVGLDDITLDTDTTLDTNIKVCEHHDLWLG
jgi:hypothetical protein